MFFGLIKFLKQLLFLKTLNLFVLVECLKLSFNLWHLLWLEFLNFSVFKTCFESLNLSLINRSSLWLKFDSWLFFPAFEFLFYRLSIHFETFGVACFIIFVDCYFFESFGLWVPYLLLSLKNLSIRIINSNLLHKILGYFFVSDSFNNFFRINLIWNKDIFLNQWLGWLNY